ncbi:helix-turn-helix domain-containing protein [Kitasatospora sp. NPDC057542]|uniref:helix-turn-helix domain-containing protein n=1 Tax=Streptomycetaceae TaxID=2062 RepID=UPI001CC92FB8|nr:helix-turn-helix domain-containing protein [Streptomyces sp. LS1784]
MTSVTDPAGFPEDGNTGHRWSRAVSIAAMPVTVASYEPASDPGRMTTQQLGHLLFITTEAGPRCYTRDLREIARGTRQAEGFFVVAVMGATGAVVQQDGRTVEVPAGAVSFWYTETPHVVDYPDGVDVRVCLLPRRAFGVRDEQLERVTATVADAGGPVAALVKQSLLTLVETAKDCPGLVAGRLACNFADLVATLVTEQASRDAPATEDSRHTRIWEIHAYVDRHLKEPELGPQTIAAAHGISVRSLHKLFEGEGTTVSRLIQRRRLQASAEDLTRKDSGDSTVSGVAQRWGFTDPAHFSRLFRASYGISPSQWRDTRGGTEPSDPRDTRGPVSR